MKNRWMANAFDGVSDEYISDAYKGKKKSSGIARVLGAAAACICIVLGTAFSAYAFSEDVRSYINLRFFKNNLRITAENIPEGYTAIYDAEGLDAVRNDLEGNYILMSDIHFTEADFAEGGRFEGGWVPIGNGEAPFCGVFNGNGYVIHGLRVDTEKQYAGLFGYIYVTDIGKIGGVVKNLGMRDAKISMTTDIGNECYAGVIAGKAEIIAGCFVENSEVHASYASYGDFKYAHIGGICGDVYIADSCYADVKVQYTEYSFAEKSEKYYPTAYVGAFAGSSFSVINSISLGSAECLGAPNGDTAVDMLVANAYCLPKLINGHAFYKLIDALMLEYGDSIRKWTIEYKYIDALVFDPQDYVLYTPDPHSMEEILAYYDVCVKHRNMNEEERAAYRDTLDEAYNRYAELPREEKWYRITEDIVTREKANMLEIIETVYSEDELRNMLLECGMKVGIIDSYTELQEEYVGFDTEKIWRIEKDGTPKLRIFD